MEEMAKDIANEAIVEFLRGEGLYFALRDYARECVTQQMRDNGASDESISAAREVCGEVAFSWTKTVDDAMTAMFDEVA